MRTTLFKEMTPLAKREALLRLHGIMMSLPVAKAAAKGKGKGKGPKADRLADLERKLTAELMGQWRETYSEALRDVAQIMPEELSGEAVDIISQRLADALGPSFGSSPAMRELIHDHVERAYKYGKLAFAMTGGDLSLRDMKAVDVLTRHDCFWIGEHYGSHVGPRVSELAREALDQGLGRQALAGMLRQELGKVGPNGYTYWDVVASSALVRARSFGSISGMSDAGITEYEILAMDDERMCPICGEMDGRTFSVAAAKATIDAAIGLSSPDAFKAAMPWQKGPAIGRSRDDLVRSGQAMPPFHGRCRCVTVMAEEGKAPITAESFPEVDPATVVSFDEDTRIVQIEARKIPTVGLPHWKYDRISKRGMQTRRFFGHDGLPFLDIDFNDHDKPKAHPYGPHAHAWSNGVRTKDSRTLRRWEVEMMEEMQKAQAVKKEGPLRKAWDDDGRMTVEDFIYSFDVGGEIEFSYDGHYYGAADYGPAQAWEAHKEETYAEFKDVHDLLDNFRLHTGETLREAMPKLELESAAVWPSEWMERIELELLTDEKVSYRYYPDGKTPFGIVSLMRKTGKRIHERSCPEGLSLYAEQAWPRLEEYQRAGEFPKTAQITWRDRERGL